MTFPIRHSSVFGGVYVSTFFLVMLLFITPILYFFYNFCDFCISLYWRIKIKKAPCITNKRKLKKKQCNARKIKTEKVNSPFCSCFFPPSLQEKKNFTFKHFPGFRPLYSRLTQQNTLAVTQSRWKNFEKLDDRARKSFFPLAKKMKIFFFINPWAYFDQCVLCCCYATVPNCLLNETDDNAFLAHVSRLISHRVLSELAQHRRCGCVRETFFVLILQLSNRFWNTDTNFAWWKF